LRNFWVLQIRLQTKKHVNKGILKGNTAQNTSKFSKLLTSGVKVGLRRYGIVVKKIRYCCEEDTVLLRRRYGIVRVTLRQGHPPV
ncbi:MAG: hypothetical protein II949_00350, partial [Prevotella sp.]|nr:hypothetical protein [Prevotella sp.]